MGVILQLSTSTAWQSAVICRVTHCRFSHVDFVLPDGNLLGASDNSKVPVLAGNRRGVGIRTPDYQAFAAKARIDVDCEFAEKVYASAMSQLGKPFDGAAIHQFLSGTPAPPWSDTGQWYCAEHTTWAFWVNGFWPFKLAVNMGRICVPELLCLLNPHFDAAELDKAVT